MEKTIHTSLIQIAVAIEINDGDSTVIKAQIVGGIVYCIIPIYLIQYSDLVLRLKNERLFNSFR